MHVAEPNDANAGGKDALQAQPFLGRHCAIVGGGGSIEPPPEPPWLRACTLILAFILCLLCLLFF